MKVHLYAPCWNEERMLPFFLRHYESWVDRFVIFDDGSTDRSLEILRAHPRVETRRLVRSDPHSLTLSLRDFFDAAWKESRGSADWIVTTKIDEHFHHPSIGPYLEGCKAAGVTLIPALGYQMITDDFPGADELLCHTRTRGVPWLNMSKVGIFDPRRIQDMNFSPGRHSAAPSGEVVLPPQDELLMLHYKYLGLDYADARHRQCRPRQGVKDIERRWVHKWRWDMAQLQADVAAMRGRIRCIADPAAQPHHLTHDERRWWRRLPSSG